MKDHCLIFFNLNMTSSIIHLGVEAPAEIPTLFAFLNHPSCNCPALSTKYDLGFILWEISHSLLELALSGEPMMITTSFFSAKSFTSVCR